MHNEPLERLKVLDVIHLLGNDWKIIAFDPDAGWCIQHPFMGEGYEMALYLCFNAEGARLTHSWIPGFKHVLNGEFLKEYDALIHNKALRFAKNLKLATCAKQLASIIPEYQRILGIACDNVQRRKRQDERTKWMLSSLVPPQFADQADLDVNWRSLSFDLGSERDAEGKEYAWKEIKTTVRNDQISGITIHYPTFEVAQAVFDLVLRMMPPVQKEEEAHV